MDSSSISAPTRRAKPAPVAPSRERLSLDLEPGSKDNLEAIRARAKLSSLTELVRKSVALFDVATAHQQEGGKLVFRHADGTEEILILL